MMCFDKETCTECEYKIRADEREKVLEEVEKLYTDWLLYTEYGKKADTDNLTIRVINHLKSHK